MEGRILPVAACVLLVLLCIKTAAHRRGRSTGLASFLSPTRWDVKRRGCHSLLQGADSQRSPLTSIDVSDSSRPPLPPSADSADMLPPWSPTREELSMDLYGELGLPIDAPQSDVERAWADLKWRLSELPDSFDNRQRLTRARVAHSILSHPDKRGIWEDAKYALEKRDNVVFVDEFTCIGCTNCNGWAPGVFKMEELWGRARAYNQDGASRDDIQNAIDTCPVDCIYWVPGYLLPFLEEATRSKDRVEVGIFQGSGWGGFQVDVFQAAESMYKKQQKNRREREARARGQDASQGPGRPLWPWERSKLVSEAQQIMADIEDKQNTPRDERKATEPGGPEPRLNLNLPSNIQLRPSKRKQQASEAAEDSQD